MEESTCSVPECGKRHLARGFCESHYQAWRTGRRPDLEPLAKQARQGRTCKVCGKEIPPHRTAQAKFCSPLCKRRAQVQRERVTPPARRNEPCSVEGCGSAWFARGLCSKHYDRLRTKGTVEEGRKNARGVCSVQGCSNPHVAGGLCRLHYDRQQRARRKAERLDTRPDRTCLSCDGPLQPGQRDDTLFCSRKCKEAERVASGRHSDAVLRHYYRSRYGMTREEAVERFGDRCNICGSADGMGRHGNLHVDHSHKTGKVRGVLCHECNTGLGKFRDDPELLRKAAAYLERDALLIM
jgi:hypothetical protein